MGFAILHSGWKWNNLESYQNSSILASKSRLDSILKHENSNINSARNFFLPTMQFAIWPRHVKCSLSGFFNHDQYALESSNQYS